ncbi:unnamed protein product, partial [Ilex paraguariensis]
TVVASIASDQNVWNAVLQNKALLEFIQSHKTDIDPGVKGSVAEADFQNEQSPKSFDDPGVKESVAEENFQNEQSPQSFDESSDLKESASGNGFMDYLQSIRLTVVDMMSNLSDYFQSFFGGSAGEKPSPNDDGSARTTCVDAAIGASVMGLVVMVIMVVVLKRV